MTSKYLIIILIVLFLLIGILFAQEKELEFSELKGPYLGQKPPGISMILWII